MRVFKSKHVSKWAKKKHISDTTLWDAAREIAEGKIDADLGKGLVKKRLAMEGQGKRGSYRLIVAYKRPNPERIFFIDYFAKNEKSNLADSELVALQMTARDYLAASDELLNKVIGINLIIEIKNGESNE